MEKTKNIKIDVDTYNKVKQVRKDCGILIKEIIKRAVDYYLSRTDLFFNEKK